MATTGVVLMIADSSHNHNHHPQAVLARAMAASYLDFHPLSVNSLNYFEIYIIILKYSEMNPNECIHLIIIDSKRWFGKSFLFRRYNGMEFSRVLNIVRSL